LKELENEIKFWHIINNSSKLLSEISTNNPAEKILLEGESLQIENLNDKNRGIHDQLIILNFLQIILSGLSLLIVTIFVWGDIFDIWIQYLLLFLALLLLAFHIRTNSKYI
jgi:hypothetical protein